jgi:hypothetical protein
MTDDYDGPDHVAPSYGAVVVGAGAGGGRIDDGFPSP